MAISGFSAATTTPSIVLWASQYIIVDGKIGSLVNIALAIGVLAGTPVVAYAFEEYSLIWFIYLERLACLTNLCLLITMFGSVRYLSKSYHRPEIIEIQ